MTDQDQLTAISQELHKQGLRILQGYRLGWTDREHMAALLDYIRPAQNTHWLDMGCGFGEPARLLRELRPDLTFTLVNNNAFQLRQVPDDIDAMYCDMHETPFEPDTFDGVMFLYSLSRAGDPLGALKEAARVVRPGGRLFVYDHFRIGGDVELTYQYMKARYPGYLEMQVMTSLAGWDFDGVVIPDGNYAVFRALFAEQAAVFEEIFKDLRPVVWWATRHEVGVK